MRRYGRIARIFAMGGVLSLLATVSTTAASGASTARVAASASGSPVIVTQIASLTGTGPEYWQDAVDGAKAAVAAVNAAGGIGTAHHKLVLDVCDDQWSSTAGEACGRAAVADHSIAVIDNTAIEADAATIYAAGIPCIGCIAATDGEINSPLNYTVGAGGFSIATGEGWILGALGLKHVAIPYAQIPGIEVYADLTPGLHTTSPNAVQTNIGIPETATDMAPYAAQMAAPGIDGVGTLLAYGTVVTLMSAFLDTNSTAKIVIPYEDFQPSLLKALGSAINRVVWSSSTLPGQGNAPGTAQFKKEIKAAKVNLPIDGAMITAWASIHAISDVMAKSTTMTAAGLLAAMKTAGTIKLGVVEPFNWAKPVEKVGQIDVYSNARYFFTYNGKTVTPVFPGFQDITKAPTQKAKV